MTERPSRGRRPSGLRHLGQRHLHGWVHQDGYAFPLTIETKRIDPGQKNTWEFEATGLDGGVRFSTKNPKQVESFSVVDVPGGGREQSGPPWTSAASRCGRP